MYKYIVYAKVLKDVSNEINKIMEEMGSDEKVSIETKIANLFKIKGKKKALLEERKRLIELIKELQDEYLNKAKIEIRVYENMLKSYATRLSEVDSEITYLEAQEALKKNKFLGKKFLREK